MRMSGFNQSFQSHSGDSHAAHFNNPPQTNIKYNQSSIGIHMPENGGMLKKAIRFEY